jgi:hypothetical protein
MEPKGSLLCSQDMERSSNSTSDVFRGPMQTISRHSLISKCHTVSWCDHTCGSLHAHKQSTVVRTPGVLEPTTTRHRHVASDFTKMGTDLRKVPIDINLWPGCTIYMVQPGRLQITTQYEAYALHTGQLRLQTHTQNMKFFFFFPTETMVTRTPINLLLSRFILWLSFLQLLPSCYVTNFILYFATSSEFAFNQPLNHLYKVNACKSKVGNVWHWVYNIS